MTAYVDAIKLRHLRYPKAENRTPVGTGYHINFYQSEKDQVNGVNLINNVPNGSSTPGDAERWNLDLMQHRFWRNEYNDDLLQAGGTLGGPVALGKDKPLPPLSTINWFVHAYPFGDKERIDKQEPIMHYIARRFIERLPAW